MRARVRIAIASAATAAVVLPAGWLWYDSLLPGSYSVTSMGYVDDGGVHSGHVGHPAGGRGVRSLTTDPNRPADVAVTLTVRKGRFALASGRTVDGYTVNGQSPGPVIRATAGQLVQVRLVNESVPGGVTLHWHGVDVPNAEDGVAGVTQDAVRVGQDYTYRFVADQVGTFWYHSHQVSHEQVAGGLLGALVVTPPAPAGDVVDALALVHLYRGLRTINGHEGDVRVDARPGQAVRVRVINSENGLLPAWVGGAAFRVLAVDGTDVNGPAPVRDTRVDVAAGGRADLEVTVPPTGTTVRVHLGGPQGLVLGAAAAVPPPVVARPTAALDLLSYGAPAPLPFDPAQPDRRFTYDMGRRPGFLDGKPGLFWTVNGHLYPDIPMFQVTEGDVVRMRIANGSGEAHPMHLHGHHVVVLARDGVPASGAPWWADSLDVANGESYDVAFVADNPGIWMDHCHNLPHVAEGLVAHLMYEGVTTPFTVGGSARNEPE